jgi:hypothetical protein
MFTQEEKEAIQDAITKINAIPSENIISSDFTNGKDSGCVIGHLNRLSSKNPEDFSNDNCSDSFVFQHPIRLLSRKFLNPDNDSPYGVDLAFVNNGELKQYSQETPKERSLACLEDMLKTETVEVAEA